jgi:hypothetical protein
MNEETRGDYEAPELRELGDVAGFTHLDNSPSQSDDISGDS